MVGNAWSSVSVLRKEEKQPALEAMIAADLKRRQTGTGSLDADDYYVVARSPDSPVIQALRALSDQLASAGITVHCIFSAATQPTYGKHPQTSDSCVFRSRQLVDARLLEAHEFLYLGQSTCWVGDCMRRDPAAFDAYEQFNVNSTDAAGHVRMTFNHFWPLARPMRFAAAKAAPSVVEQPLESDIPAAHDAETPKDVLQRALSLTRH